MPDPLSAADILREARLVELRELAAGLSEAERRARRALLRQIAREQREQRRGERRATTAADPAGSCRDPAGSSPSVVDPRSPVWRVCSPGNVSQMWKHSPPISPRSSPGRGRSWPRYNLCEI